jgi:NAD(P)-dependent dehydrogenase (short-subunit alcohol dehydrogenase family)
VTGAGGGIGKTISKAFAKKGAYLIINDLLEDRANLTRQEIVDEGGKVISIQYEVTSKEQLSEMVKRILSEAEYIGVLVNNAGIFKPSEFFDLDEKHWDRTFTVNVKGMFLCYRLVSREMIKRNTGGILNLASITAKIPFQNYVDYCCTKAAVV